MQEIKMVPREFDLKTTYFKSSTMALQAN